MSTYGAQKDKNQYLELSSTLLHFDEHSSCLPDFECALLDPEISNVDCYCGEALSWVVYQANKERRKYLMANEMKLRIAPQEGRNNGKTVW